MKPIRVLIVEDSPVVREHLRRIISADSRFEVAATASTGEEALDLVETVSPDVISMDIHLPGIQGFETTRRIMARRPTPIVVVSGIGSEEVSLTMQALKAGALAVVEKPVATTHQDYDAMAGRLCTQLAIMSEVTVIRQRLTSPPLRSSFFPERRIPAPYKVLGVGASTGGPSALAQLLSGFGPLFTLPVLVVQHMAPGFMEGFASWLDSVIPMPVSIVAEPTPLIGGRVYLAPADRHLIVDGNRADVDDSPAIANHRPSADMLFASLARSAGPVAIGVLLTGMGDDGAAGLKELRAAGGFTIAEDPSTAVVYGMPAAAVASGAVCESLPLGEIADRVLELFAVRQESR